MADSRVTLRRTNIAEGAINITKLYVNVRDSEKDKGGK